MKDFVVVYEGEAVIVTAENEADAMREAAGGEFHLSVEDLDGEWVEIASLEIFTAYTLEVERTLNLRAGGKPVGITPKTKRKAR